ncbi:MAG: mersacidin/lichenicidin family type 2 lantibiotic [bacterium]
MSVRKIIRAWKDADYRRYLRDTQMIPEHPAGEIMLSDEDLKEAAGGWSTVTNYSCSPTPECCPSPTCQ